MKKIISTSIVCLFGVVFQTALAQSNKEIKAVSTLVHPVNTETTASIMQRQSLSPNVKFREKPELEYPERNHLKQSPLAPAVSSYPANAQQTIQFNNSPNTPSLTAPQTISTTFNAVTGPTETGAFPPDDMGAIGPAQYILFVNGKIKSFNKSTGVADGVLNANPAVFFNSVMTPPTANNFASDPRIRYDRLSGKWLLIMIDIPGFSFNNPNRCILAVSNSAIITGTTTWTFSQFLGQAGQFFDYPTLGLDVNAAYIGGNMFSTTTGNYTGTNGYVINRSNLMAGGLYTLYTFTGLALGTGAGPFTPQGVDNFDPSATEGYFIGVDNASFGNLQILRVNNPAGVPTISGNLPITVPSTYVSRKVPHLGNTNGANGELDGLDDRLYAAMIRGGHLWTAHNIAVNANGIATTGATGRNAARWYDIINLTSTPALNQSGTIYDNAVAATSAKDYFIPSIMVSGQGHAAFSLCTAGNNFRINAATTGRLTTDPLGTTQGLPVLTTTSSTAYNPPADPGDPFYGRRWGDYSYVSLDPLDDMTMWMINQYCVGTNLYGCNVTKLLAPPPATPASCSPAINAGVSSVNVVVTGTSVNGSAFYDPGTNLPSPALPFNHITASVTGGVVVNSVTYTDPTHITLNINTTGAAIGCQFITITNPDGQSVTSPVCILTVNAINCNISLTSATSTNAQTKCVNTAINNITYATIGATGATFNGLPTGITGNWAANVVTISGTPTATGTFNYTVTPTGGGCGTITANGTITVNTLSAAATTAISNITSSCQPTAVNLSIQGGALGTGAVWKWYSGSCGGTAIGTGPALSNIPVNATTTFYVRAEGTCNTTTCASVTVAINPVPTISISASPYISLMPGLLTTLTATVLPPAAGNTFIWYRDAAIVPGVTGNSLTVSVDGLGKYTASVTTALGCTALTPSAIDINDSASNKLFISPNPNNGYFTVRYYTSSRNYGFLRNLSIFNSMGERVFTQKFPVSAPYSRMDVDLRKLSTGIYVVVLSDYYGKILAQGKVIMQ